MALNKSHTSPLVKGFIIVLIVAFVTAFMASGIVGLFDLFQPSNSGPATPSVPANDPVAAINARYQSGVEALTNVTTSQPTSYTAAVNLANTYFDWAKELSTPASGQSQLTTPAMVAASQQWAAARGAYAKAVKLKPNDPPVTIDYSVATFYSGDASGAVTLAVGVTKSKPDFSPAWLNLGIFYERLGQNQLALAAFQRYLALDPKGQSATFAQQQVATLSKSAPSATTTTP